MNLRRPSPRDYTQVADAQTSLRSVLGALIIIRRPSSRPALMLQCAGCREVEQRESGI
jgi:hypothetical protein